MAVMVRCALLLVVSTVAAATDCAMPLGAVALPRSSCSGYVLCESAMCNCASGVYSNQACSFGRPTCGTLDACLTNYTQCFKRLIVTATQQTTDCSAWAYRAYTDLLAALAGNPLTELQQSCEWQVCVIRNLTDTREDKCPSINASFYCDFSSVENAWTPTPQPPTQEPFFDYVFMGQLGLNGSWTTLRDDVGDAWIPAVTTDLAKYFVTYESEIGIARMDRYRNHLATVITNKSITFSVSLSTSTQRDPLIAETQFRKLLQVSPTWLNATRALFANWSLNPSTVFVISATSVEVDTPAPYVPPPPCEYHCASTPLGMSMVTGTVAMWIMTLLLP